MSAKTTNAAPARTDIPKKGLAGFKENWKADLLAGFTVSLIALPLCLGISLASGVPPMAGIITAIVGGMLASRVSGSNVTISGPAAGLIVITLGAVETLGGGDHVIGYPLALAAILIAGAIVVLFGLLKVGKLGDFFPSAAVHGMLAAIGIIIMVKQTFTALGAPQAHGEFYEIVAQLPAAFANLNPEVFVIACISLAILIVYPMIDNKWIKMVPAPMWVLIATIPLSFAFDLFDEHHYHFAGADFVIGPKYLVNLPAKLSDAVVLPNFGAIGTSSFWTIVVTFALVSGLESLLSAKAVDTLDPWKRKSNLDRDLMAMGGGSALAAAIGGLPMISEIVRSSANINNGGRSQWANLFHGTFLLIFVLLLKPIIMMIPLSALAAMLIFTGFRLASPKEFRHMAQISWKQLVVFVVTVIVVLLTDLLIGIGAGIVTEFIIIMFLVDKPMSILKVKSEEAVSGQVCRITLHDSMVFSNYLGIKKRILRNADCQDVIIDFANVRFVDHTVMANLTDLQAEFASKGKTLTFENLQRLQALSSHPLAPRTVNSSQKSLVAHLTRRQLELMVYALQNRYDYLPEEWEEHGLWSGFKKSDGWIIERVTSVFVKKGDGYRLTLADLRMSTGALLTLETNEITYLRINLKAIKLPAFRISIESGMDKLAEKLGAQDIDFPDFPKFSMNFLLQGADEVAIRAFFTPAIIQLLEANPDVTGECAGNALLFRLNRGLASEQGIERLLKFGRSFCELAISPESGN
jgi:MFS superfamily sulfate permease-like transporter